MKDVTLSGEAVAASVEAESIACTPEVDVLRGTQSRMLPDDEDRITITKIIREQEKAARAFLVSPQVAQHARSAIHFSKSGYTEYSQSEAFRSGGSFGSQSSGLPASSLSGAKFSPEGSVDQGLAVTSPASNDMARGQCVSGVDANVANTMSVSDTSGFLSASYGQTQGMFTIPPSRLSASALGATFGISAALSPTTRALFFGEKTPMFLSFAQGTNTILPPPTPSAFSSLPAMKSPSLAKHFASSTFGPPGQPGQAGVFQLDGLPESSTPGPLGSLGSSLS